MGFRRRDRILGRMLVTDKRAGGAAEAARWVDDALENARTWFAGVSDDELREPLEQAFELASGTARTEREFHAVFEGELRRVLEERDVMGSADSVLSSRSSVAPVPFQVVAGETASEEPEPEPADPDRRRARPPELRATAGELRHRGGSAPAPPVTRDTPPRRGARGRRRRGAALDSDLLGTIIRAVLAIGVAAAVVVVAIASGERAGSDRLAGPAASGGAQFASGEPPLGRIFPQRTNRRAKERAPRPAESRRRPQRSHRRSEPRRRTPASSRPTPPKSSAPAPAPQAPPPRPAPPQPAPRPSSEFGLEP
jgi:hypothetical protein